MNEEKLLIEQSDLSLKEIGETYTTLGCPEGPEDPSIIKIDEGINLLENKKEEIEGNIVTGCIEEVEDPSEMIEVIGEDLKRMNSLKEGGYKFLYEDPGVCWLVSKDKRLWKAAILFSRENLI